MRSKAEPISKHVLKGFNFYVKNFYVDNQVIVICTELLKALGKKNKTLFISKGNKSRQWSYSTPLSLNEESSPFPNVANFSVL